MGGTIAGLGPGSEPDVRFTLLKALHSRFGAKTIDLAGGDTLMYEGDTADRVYVLVRGSMTVTKSVNGHEAVLARIEKPGSVVGEMVTMGGGLDARCL